MPLPPQGILRHPAKDSAVQQLPYSDKVAAFSELIRKDLYIHEKPRVDALCWKIGGMTPERVDFLLTSVNAWEQNHADWARTLPPEDQPRLFGFTSKVTIAAPIPKLPPRAHKNVELNDKNVFSLGAYLEDDVVSHFMMILARSNAAIAAANGHPPAVIMDAILPAAMLGLHRGLSTPFHATLARFQARPYIARALQTGASLLVPVCDNAHYNLGCIVTNDVDDDAAASIADAVAKPVQRAMEQISELRNLSETFDFLMDTEQRRAHVAAVDAAKAAGESDAKVLDKIGAAASHREMTEQSKQQTHRLALMRGQAAKDACGVADAPPDEHVAASGLRTDITVGDSLMSYGLDVKVHNGLKRTMLTERGAFGLGTGSGSVHGNIAARTAGQGDSLSCGAFTSIAALFVVHFGRMPEHTDYGMQQGSASMSTIELREAQRRARVDAVALRLIMLDVVTTGRIRWPGEPRRAGRISEADAPLPGTFVPRDDTADTFARLKFTM